MRPTRPGSTPSRPATTSPPGQASDVAAWRESVRRIRSLRPGTGAFLPPHRPRAQLRRPSWIFGGAGTYTPPDGGEPNHWVVHLNSEDLSLGTYSIPAGGVDDQEPHTEDEIYVVQAGRATLVTPSGTAAVGPGSVIFVPAGETHRFTDITEDLALVVVFAPPYGSRAPG